MTQNNLKHLSITFIFLVIIINFYGCTSSINNINNNKIYEIKYIERYTFSDFIFYKIKNIKSDSNFYAITEKTKNIDSLKNEFEKVKVGDKYSLKFHKLMYPFILKSRSVTFFDDENGRIWEKDTMKVNLYYIENMKDQYLITY